MPWWTVGAGHLLGMSVGGAVRDESTHVITMSKYHVIINWSLIDFLPFLPLPFAILNELFVFGEPLVFVKLLGREK